LIREAVGLIAAAAIDDAAPAIDDAAAAIDDAADRSGLWD